MMTLFFRAFALPTALAFLAIAGSAGADPRVVAGRPSVTDGDTLRVGATRIRLFGIQAAELDTSEGQAARRHLVQLIGRSSVRCVDTGQRSYDRIVARCFVGHADLAEQMVADGWAADWPRFSRGAYAAAERRARLARRGVHASGF